MPKCSFDAAHQFVFILTLAGHAGVWIGYKFAATMLASDNLAEERRSNLNPPTAGRTRLAEQNRHAEPHAPLEKRES